MGGHKDIVHVEQGIVRRSGLFLQNVEPCCHNLPSLQSPDESRLVNHRPATGVDQHCGGFHEVKFSVANHASGLPCQWHMQRDNVRAAQQVIEADPYEV